jgi:hypothetical protein
MNLSNELKALDLDTKRGRRERKEETYIRSALAFAFFAAAASDGDDVVVDLLAVLVPVRRRRATLVGRGAVEVDDVEGAIGVDEVFVSEKATVEEDGRVLWSLSLSISLDCCSTETSFDFSPPPGCCCCCCTPPTAPGPISFNHVANANGSHG